MTKYPVSSKIRKTAAALLLSTAIALPMPLTNGNIVDYAITTASAATSKTVKLSQKSATIYIDSVLSLTLNNATASKVTWSSSNTKVAKVNSKGKVTALKKGTATITAKYKKKTYKCKVTVLDPLKIDGMDLGGMEIIVRDWWTTDDTIYTSTEYDKARKEWIDYIQDTYNFTIKTQKISDWGSAPSDFIDYTTTGGDKNNYIFVLREDSAISSAMNVDNILYDLSTIKWLDFSSNKFKKNSTDEKYSVGNAIYAMSDAPIIPGTGVFFNKKVLKKAGIDPESLYDMQKNGTWTWDKFEEICKKVQRDVNGDGELDYYGMTLNEAVMVDAAVFSNNGSYVSRDSKGKFAYNLESKNTLEALNWCQKMFDKYDEKNPIYAADLKYKNIEYAGSQIYDAESDSYIDLSAIALFDDGREYYTYEEFQNLLERNGLEYDSENDLYIDQANKCYYGSHQYYAKLDWNYFQTEFLEGKVAFCIESAYNALSYGFLNDADFDFGFVMFPKGPKAKTYLNNETTSTFCAIPGCYSKDKAEKIAFAWNLYTMNPKGYENHDESLSGYYTSKLDSRAKNETLALMTDSKYSAIDYSTLISNINVGADLTWSAGPGKNVAESIDQIRDLWKQYIKQENR